MLYLSLQYPSLELPRAMFGAVYWVRVTTKQINDRQVSQQVFFVTPPCEDFDHVTTRCANQRFSEERVKTTSSYTKGSCIISVSLFDKKSL